MNGIALYLSMLVTVFPLGGQASYSPSVPRYLRPHQLTDIERTLRRATRNYWIFDNDDSGLSVQANYPDVKRLRFGPPNGVGTDFRLETVVVFESGKALTAAHILRLNDEINHNGVVATCLPHPCYIDDDPVTGTGKQWDLAYCKGVGLAPDVSKPNKLLFNPALVAGRTVAAVGFGCDLDVPCPTTSAILDLLLAGATGGSLEPTMANLFISASHPHRSILQIQPGLGRCTVVCNGDSGGAVYSPSNSHSVIGIISKYDKLGNSYFTVLDSVSESWIKSVDAGTIFDESQCN